MISLRALHYEIILLRLLNQRILTLIIVLDTSSSRYVFTIELFFNKWLNHASYLNGLIDPFGYAFAEMLLIMTIIISSIIVSIAGCLACIDTVAGLILNNVVVVYGLRIGCLVIGSRIAAFAPWRIATVTATRHD